MADEKKSGPSRSRPFWSGTISFGLVSVPVELFVAARSSGHSLRMLGPGGTPLARRYYCSRDGKPLGADDIVRGYPRDDGGYVVVSDQELDAIEPRKSRDIDLRSFVDRAAIDPQMVERPYILAPAGQSTKAYHVLAHTMERDRRAGIATMVMRGKQYLVAILAEDGVLSAVTLRFLDDLRTPASIGLPERRPAGKARRRDIDRALDAVAQGELDQSLLRDTDAARLRELAEQKRSQARDVVEVPEELAAPDDDGGAVIDIMSVLRERLGAARAGKTRRAGAAAPEREPFAGQSKKALYQRARELGIEGRSTMSKDQLIDAIRSSEAIRSSA